jgi:hypothetical protein
MQQYRHLAPHLILWGCIWLIANTVTELKPDLAQTVWNWLSSLGVVTSMWIGYRSKYRQSHPFAANSAEAHGERGFRVLLTILTVFGYFTALWFIAPRMDPKQFGAIISLFWAAYYLIVGIWVGIRMFIVGVLTSASTLIAYFVIPDHYFLWMGLVTGSLLILGGAWLRRI